LLQVDRVLEIRVNNVHAAPYLVQQKFLESVSPVFAQMCNNHDWIEGATGRLTFMEDDEEVWQAFLYWLVKHEIDFVILFKASAASMAIKSACFADKYNIDEFFDQAMSCLIDLKFAVSIESLRAAFEATTADCPLRELLAEKAVYAVHAKTIKLDKLANLDGTGFLPLYLKFYNTVCPIKNISATTMADNRNKIIKRSFRGARKSMAKAT
jgi:hypothetical protein